jgi:triphosphoribosyl-dephospho-CoA synthetase
LSESLTLRGQNVTETIAWNWKENVKVGVNLLLRKLALAFAEPKPKKTKKAKKKAGKKVAKANPAAPGEAVKTAAGVPRAIASSHIGVSGQDSHEEFLIPSGAHST